jgi:hypothetical protein
LGLLLPRAEYNADPGGATAHLDGCPDAQVPVAAGLARLQVDAPPQAIAAWDASAAALRAVMWAAGTERLGEGVGRSAARALDVLAQVLRQGRMKLLGESAPCKPDAVRFAEQSFWAGALVVEQVQSACLQPELAAVAALPLSAWPEVQTARPVAAEH